MFKKKEAPKPKPKVIKNDNGTFTITDVKGKSGRYSPHTMVRLNGQLETAEKWFQKYGETPDA